MNSMLETWITAIGWALVHSLWQFGLLSLGTALLLRLFRRQSPNLRYRFVTGALLLAFLSFTMTIAWQLSPIKTTLTIDNQTLAENSINKDTIGFSESAKPTVETASIIEVGREWLSNQLIWLVLCWLIGVLVFAVRFGSNYLLLNYLRHEANQPANEHWQQRLVTLKNQMNIEKAVRLLESAIVKAPMTFGHLKPVILMPMGLLANLPPEQVETLLLHELAHIRRHDFLINLLVGVLETLLFYHPAIWWLSARLNELREECCDDLVIAQGTSRVTYAESLLAISQTSKIQLAMNAKNQFSHFSLRIRRLLTPETSPQAMRPGVSILITLLFIFATAFGSLIAQNAPVVSIAVDKMNVLYIGVDNPITVAVAGFTNDQIQLRSSDVEITPKGNGQYVLQAFEPGKAVIEVKSNGKLLKESVFRVKRIPNPVPMLSRSPGGKITSNEFRAQLGVLAMLENFDIDVVCEVQSFKLIKIPHRDEAIEVINTGPKFESHTKQLIEKANKGDTYYFEEIKVKCPGESTARDVGTMVFHIQ